MNYFSELSMLKDALMTPQLFVSLQFSQWKESGCATKLTTAILNIY